MLCRDEGRDVVKVLDFGIAKAAELDTFDFRTTAGQILCTQSYAAPEIWNGQVMPCSDLYSLGLMLIEMITGQIVIQASSPREYLAKHCSIDPIPVPPLLVGSPLGTVLERATEKDHRLRYNTARQMYDALVDVVKESSPAAKLVVAGPWGDGLDVNPTKERADSSGEFGPAPTDVPQEERAGFSKLLIPTILLLAGLLFAASAWIMTHPGSTAPVPDGDTGSMLGDSQDLAEPDAEAEPDVEAEPDAHTETGGGEPTSSDLGPELVVADVHPPDTATPEPPEVITPDSPEDVAVEDPLASLVWLEIESDPSGGDLRINGTFVGQTPIDLNYPRADGTITVEIRLSGYRRWREEVALDNEEVHVIAELRRRSSSGEADVEDTQLEPDVGGVDTNVFQIIELRE